MDSMNCRDESVVEHGLYIILNTLFAISRYHSLCWDWRGLLAMKRELWCGTGRRSDAVWDGCNQTTTHGVAFTFVLRQSTMVFFPVGILIFCKAKKAWSWFKDGEGVLKAFGCATGLHTICSALVAVPPADGFQHRGIGSLGGDKLLCLRNENMKSFRLAFLFLLLRYVLSALLWRRCDVEFSPRSLSDLLWLKSLNSRPVTSHIGCTHLKQIRNDLAKLAKDDVVESGHSAQ